MIRSRLLLTGLLAVAVAAIALVGGQARAASPTPPRVGAAPPKASVARPAVTGSSTVIYDNLGPANNYEQFQGWCIDGTAAPCGVFALIAQPFTGNGGRLTQIDLALTHYGGTNAATVELHADSAGLPGELLRTWSVTDLPPYGSCCPVTSLAASPSIPVGTGKVYWIVVTPGADDTSVVWNWNTQGAAGTWADDLGSGWSPFTGILSAYRVLGCSKLCKT
jgi:hypothetical protein